MPKSIITITFKIIQFMKKITIITALSVSTYFYNAQVGI